MHYSRFFGAHFGAARCKFTFSQFVSIIIKAVVGGRGSITNEQLINAFKAHVTLLGLRGGGEGDIAKGRE
jgi:hypothetical protein